MIDPPSIPASPPCSACEGYRAEIEALREGARLSQLVGEEVKAKRENIARKCCEAMTVLRIGGEPAEMVAALREILLPNTSAQTLP